MVFFLWINFCVDGRINIDFVVDFFLWFKLNWFEEQEQFLYICLFIFGVDLMLGEEMDFERYFEK